MAEVRHVNADLMCLTSLGKQADEREVAVALHDEKVRLRRPAAMLDDGHLQLVRRMHAGRRFDFPLFVAQATNDQRDVLFRDLIVLKLRTEVALGSAVQSKEQNAAGF